MKRMASVSVLLTALGGCMTAGHPPASGTCGGGVQGGWTPEVPGVQGPWGQPVAMASPYAAAPPGAMAARAMMSQSVPLDFIDMNAAGRGGIMPAGGPAAATGGVVQAGGFAPVAPPGVPTAPNVPAMLPPPGAVAAAGALTGHLSGRFPSQRTSVRFINPPGMRVSWYSPGANGRVSFDANQLETPGRYNFVQAAIYRLKLSNIANRPGLELYPTLEVVPANMRTESFLAHSSVPVSFTDEDFEQVAAGNFLVKVIYLPDPAFQDLATTGPDEVVSTRLEPGADPIAEARRRGSILLVVRLGNIDLEAPNTPPMETPSPYFNQRPMPPHPGMGGMPGPGPMRPYGPAVGHPPMPGPGGPVGMAPFGMPGMPPRPGMPMPPMGAGPPAGPGGMMGPGAGVPTSRLPDPSELKAPASQATASAAPVPTASAGDEPAPSLLGNLKGSMQKSGWWRDASAGQ